MTDPLVPSTPSTEPPAETEKGKPSPPVTSLMILSLLASVFAIVLILFFHYGKPTSSDSHDSTSSPSLIASEKITTIQQDQADLRKTVEELRGTISKQPKEKPGESARQVEMTNSLHALRSELERLDEKLQATISRLDVQEEERRKEQDQQEISEPIEPASRSDVLALQELLANLQDTVVFHIENYENHVHGLELRDLREGWNTAFPGWASDINGLRFDTSDRRLTPPIPSDDKNATWSQTGLGSGGTQQKKR